MKVLVTLTDQSFFRTKSIGIFNVSMGLTKGLINCPEITELHILGNNECKETFADVPPHVHVHLTDMPVPRRFKRVWWDQFGLSAAIRKIAPDWAILPKGVPPFFPCLGKTKLACYVHDVMWEHYQQRSASDRKGPFPLHEFIYFSKLSLHAMKISDLVLTSSQFNLQRFKHYCPSCNASVIGIGFDDEPRLTPLCKGTDILFYASPFPHKLSILGIQRIEAWLSQRPDASNIRVHVIGNLPKTVTLPSVQWISHGKVSHAELQHIMQDLCRCAVYFSDYEGYGMPPVECLRAGVPCIASDIPAIRENIPAPYLFSNADEASFIHTANSVFDGSIPFQHTEFPSWQEVTQRCVHALRNH